MTLKKLGLYIILIGLVAKMALQNLYPNGILIDLCRLSFFIGIIVFLIGVFRKK